MNELTTLLGGVCETHVGALPRHGGTGRLGKAKRLPAITVFQRGDGTVMVRTWGETVAAAKSLAKSVVARVEAAGGWRLLNLLDLDTVPANDPPGLSHCLLRFTAA
jgi:hypothetical protein